MSILDLSKSLVDAVNSVIKTDNEESVKLNEKIVKDGLSNFGVSSVAELSELDQKKLASWVQRKLEEASCCGCKNVKEVLDLTSGTEEEAIKRAIDDFLKSDAPQFDGKSKDEIIDMAVAAVKSARGTATKEKQESIEEMRTPYVVIDTADGNKVVAKSSTERDAKSSIFHSEKPPMKIKNKKSLKIVKTSKKQDIGFPLNEEVESEDIATNGAVGVTDPEEQMPVAVDVIKEVDTEGGDKKEVHYRLFVQFNVNDLPKIVPPPSLPGAKSVEELRDLVSGLPYYGEKVEDALASASEAEVAKM